MVARHSLSWHSWDWRPAGGDSALFSCLLLGILTPEEGSKSVSPPLGLVTKYTQLSRCASHRETGAPQVQGPLRFPSRCFFGVCERAVGKTVRPPASPSDRRLSESGSERVRVQQVCSMATVNPDERNQAEPLRVCGGSTLMRQGTDACGKSRKTTNISENARMKQRSPVRFHSNTKKHQALGGVVNA